MDGVIGSTVQTFDMIYMQVILGRIDSIGSRVLGGKVLEAFV